MRLPAPDPEAWPELHAAPQERWAPLLDAVVHALGLPGAPTSRLPGGEDCAAFAHGIDRVLKVLAPGTDPAREIELLERVRLPVATPRLVGRVELGGWAALLLVRLPGLTLAEAWPTMPEPDRLRVIHEIGALLPHLAAVPPPPRTPRPDLAARTTTRLGGAAAELLAEADPLGEPVFLHGDLTDANTFATRERDGWHLCGVLDFGGSFVGPPLVELVTPALFLVGGQAPRLAALLDGAGVRASATQLAAANLLHPYAQLERDTRMLGGEGNTVEALRAAWRRLTA